MNSTTAPQLECGVNVLGDERDLCSSTYQAVIFRAEPWSNQREDCAAIRRCDRHPAAKLETSVGNHAESQLIHVEL